MSRNPKVIIVANTSWYLQNYRLPLIKELESRNVAVVAVAPYDDYSEQLKRASVRYLDVPMRRGRLNPLEDMGLMIRLYRIYKAEEPDVVFHNTIKPVIYGSIAGRNARVRCVLNMIPGLGYVFTGDRIIHQILRPLVKLMYRFALKDSTNVLFQNPEDEYYFRWNSLVDGVKTGVTYGSGVDLDHFHYVEPVSGKQECTFLMFGRILWDKGVAEFVEAAREVKQVYPESRFQLAGMIDEDNPTHIERKVINEWNNSGYINYLGVKTDVRGLIAKADVVVLPSYYKEGVPRSLLEAMAMGKPIITTDMPGCRETVMQNLNGLLIPPRNAKALSEAMQYFITQPGRRVQMGREGRKLAVERFDVRRVNREILRAMGI
jgi:glycosyltransferase involved in cell wall biosynthesis